MVRLDLTSASSIRPCRLQQASPNLIIADALACLCLMLSMLDILDATIKHIV